MEIIDGKKLREEILAKVKAEVALLPFVPVFCDVLVGEDPSSAQYVRMKGKTAESVGIKFHKAEFLSSITTPNLIREIEILNKLPDMCGIIVQLPLPAHLERRAILDAINPAFDVDCLGTEASEKFYNGKGVTGFPTALACMALLESLHIDLNYKKIVVLGQGELVGRPVASLLHSKGLNLTVVTRKTENKERLIKEADVIISGIGQGKFITGDKVKKGVILIDAGTSESNNSIVGDVDAESVKDVASFLSPVPGGVGPVTVAMLLNNVLEVAKNRKK